MESNKQNLFEFAKEGRIEELNDLLTNELDVNEPDEEGFTALHHAAKNGQLICLRRLIKAGANIETQDTEKMRRPLFHAVVCNSEDCVAELIRGGTDIDAKDVYGQTALHYASAMGYTGCIGQLLEAGADVNLVLENNFDCVRLAMAYGHEESAKTLMAAGATSHMAVLHPMSLSKYKQEVPEQAKKDAKTVLNFAEDHLQKEVLKGINSISKGLPWEVKNLDPQSADIFTNLLGEDSYELFDTRNMLVGEQGVGKTTIASFLVGKKPPEYARPTDGIGLYRGLAFLDKEEKKWLSGEKGHVWLIVINVVVVSMFLCIIHFNTRHAYKVTNKPVTGLLHVTRLGLFGLAFYLARESSPFTLEELIVSNTLKVNPLKQEKKSNSKRDVELKPDAQPRPTNVQPSRSETNVQMFSTSIQPSTAKPGDESMSPCQLTSNPDKQTFSTDNKPPIFKHDAPLVSTDAQPSSSDPKSLSTAVQPLTTKVDDEKNSTDVQFLSSKRKMRTSSKTSGLKYQRLCMQSSEKVMAHDQLEVLEHTTDLVRIAITKEKLLEKSWNVGEKRLHKLNIVPVIIWDFGGQDVFYATHQTFLTYRAIYLIVINGSRSLNDIVQEEGQYLPGKSGRKTCRDYVKFWVKTILTYCKRIRDGFPKLVIVATHKDKVEIDRVECVRKTIYDEIDAMFIDSNLKCHIVTSHRMFVNANDHNDPEMILLKEVLTELAFKQPTWGELMPSCFLPLEMELSYLVEKEDKKVITIEYLKKINRLLAIRPLTDMELQLFLKVQHALGKLLYFPVPGLDNKVILAPTHLIDAFRSIVTDRQFCGTDKIRLTSWDDMASNGIIKKSVIDYIWQKEEFRHFLDDQDYLIGLMTHLDILSEPRRYDQDGSLLSNDFYLVPSMVREIDTTEYFKSPNFHERAICLSFICSNEILPPALCYRFITFCLTVWPLKCCVENFGKQMLFEDAAVVVVDSSLDMSVHCGEDRIIVRLIHEENKSLIPEDIATSVRECLTKTLQNISQLYHQFCVEQISGESPFHTSFAVKSCCASPESPCIAPNISEMEENEPWNCPVHYIQHTARSLRAWFSPNKNEAECIDIETCPVADGMFLATCPTDLHLRRLSIELTLDEMRTLFLYLGLKSTQWENLTIGKKVENAIFESLIKWQDSSEFGTFNELKIAMEKMGLTIHKLCKVLRERFIDFEKTNPSMERMPTDKDIDRLSLLVGDNCLHFLVELGLEFQDWEQIKYKCGPDLVTTNREILMRWKQKCINETRIKPSMKSIFKAFANVGKSQRVVEKYLNKQRFQ